MRSSKKVNILLIPIDNRPVCYDFAVSICSIAEDINLFIPPREILGSLLSYADVDSLFRWVKSLDVKIDYSICCLDTIAYGGLIASRRVGSSKEEILERVDLFISLLREKSSKIFGFSSIMRISNNNINEEEKEYWNQYGKQIFDYSYNFHKNGIEPIHVIPDEILTDYLNTRERNFGINKHYLSSELDFLVYSRDDTSKYGLNVKEGEELQTLINENHSNAMVLSGADEIWAGLIARAYSDFHQQHVSFNAVYNHSNAESVITRYDGVSIKETFCSYLRMTNSTESKDEDISLIVNAPLKIQDDLALGIFEDEKFSHIFKFDKLKNYAIADVRYANGADDEFVSKCVVDVSADMKHFFGYAGWNTTANSMGSVMSVAVIKFIAERNDNFNEKEFKKLMFVRFADDWGYQANIRQMLRCGDSRSCSELFRPYISKITSYLDMKVPDIEFYFPWNRTFEIGIVLK